ncbi:MAG: hypothetical protein RLZ03_1883 [Pseudomonadota bacterium]|jgi:uncharacterized protein YkwD
MKKAAIPTVRTGQPDVDRAFDAIKQNLDAITGQARNVQRVPPLPANATLAEVITRINMLTERLQ